LNCVRFSPFLEKACAITHSMCNYLFTFFGDRSRAIANRSA
jgi:hypothetical protein